jgi:hypothetical protein
MSMTSDIIDALTAAAVALKPKPVPMRTLHASREGGLAASVLIEVDQTILLRLLTFVTPAGKRIVALAGDRKVYSIRPSDSGRVEDSAPGILSALAAFAEGQSTMSVASAPPPNAVKPKTRGILADDLLVALLRPPGDGEDEDKDLAETIRDRLGAVLHGSAIRTQRGRVMVRMEEASRVLGDHIKTVATDLSTRHNFLDDAIPGQKLVIHAGWEPTDPAIAYVGTDEKTLLMSFDTQGLVHVMAAWQSLLVERQSEG